MERPKPKQQAINPYESPTVYDSPARPEVGVWRDRDFVVMHVDAELLRICIVTGQPAVGARERRFVWRTQGSLMSRGKTIWLPLCRAELEAFRRRRIMSLVGPMLPAATILGLVLSLPAADYLGDWLGFIMVPAVLLGVAGVVMWLVAYFQPDEPIRIQYATGDYVWFAGVHPAMLQALPDWPSQQSS